MKANGCRHAFTLIEMLIVIAVIVILSGILLRVTTLVLRKTAVGKAIHDLEQIQHALNEYFIEYGSYPPVSEMVYEYEGGTTRQNPVMLAILTDPRYNSPEDPAQFLADVQRSPGEYGYGALGPIQYRYGLVSYLWPRDRGQVHWYDEDTQRDKDAKSKWAVFLADVDTSGGESGGHSINLHGTVRYTNNTVTVHDPWVHEYRYICKPPYQSYKLWSVGPDGIDGTVDDINREVKEPGS